MIKFAVGIICYYVVYCSYYVYQNVRTPVYEHVRDGKQNEKDQEGQHMSEKYIHRAFTNFFKQNDKVDYHLYMSCEENIDLNKYINEKEKYLKKNKNFINVYNINNVSYDWSYTHLPGGGTKWWNFLTPSKYPSVNLTIPRKLIKKKKEIYLHIFTYVNGELYRHGFVTRALTRGKPGGRKWTRREKYLWESFLDEEGEEEEEEEEEEGEEEGEEEEEEEEGEEEEEVEEAYNGKHTDQHTGQHTGQHTAHHADDAEGENDNDNDDDDDDEEEETHTGDASNDGQRKNASRETHQGVKFGPVIEHNDINVNKIGFFSNIFLDKENSLYLLPTYYNDHLTPEDEYELLQIGEKENFGGGRKKKKNTRGRRRRRISCHPPE
ncbi:hypothetical protein PCYB_093710 [Plasmodium cynomolgi strain B]|uniref:Uncharacterized protein n=1 Tax=Plasmodium cynomolgi (strain B) TaxID=1120755 RepID=K6UDH0_PLACD|nr:hypothetical protein PCYB_093710 [Plasmodium cynomolgi strain B]GAB66586.1 hypothetical protein PCYB_093710 [Plasmodium cynomolgi strain B]